MLLGVVALVGLASVTRLSASMGDTLHREGACIRSFASCGGGGGGGAGALPGVGTNPSGTTPSGTAPADATKPSGAKAFEWSAGTSPDGSKKFFTVDADYSATRAEVNGAAADVTFKGSGGEANLKLFAGKAQLDSGGVKVEGAMVQGSLATEVGGVKIEATGKHMAGEAGVLAGCGGKGCGLGASASGWVVKGEAAAGEMDKATAGNVKGTVFGAAFGAGAEAGVTTGDEDGDGHHEVEITLKLGLGAGVGAAVRVESPAWLSDLFRGGK